jgi:hypothetical protein
MWAVIVGVYDEPAVAAMTCHCCRQCLCGDVAGIVSGDVACGREWWLAMNLPPLGPRGHSQEQTVVVAAVVGVWDGGGGGQDVMGQCLATGSCQTLQLSLIILILLLIKLYSSKWILGAFYFGAFRETFWYQFQNALIPPE